VLIVTDHTDVDYAMVLDHASLVVDSRNATAGIGGDAAGRVVQA
jgi:UDP-N-acetyl-D-glucosamine dehydrogenase